jgi:hypothetical protein
MIQFKRGTTSVELKEISILGLKFYIPKRTPGTWKNIKLADGQPGYDKATRKLKVGDGEHTWEELPYLSSGLDAEQILDSELRARARKQINGEDTIFTYGDIDPDNEMAGQVYLQKHEGKVETDYVVEYGTANGSRSMGLSSTAANFNVNWTYRKWNSNYAECFCKIKASATSTATELGQLFVDNNSGIASIPLAYPFEFESTPVETANLVTSSSLSSAWLATAGTNTSTKSACYRIISPEKTSGSIDYTIYIKVCGFIKR